MERQDTLPSQLLDNELSQSLTGSLGIGLSQETLNQLFNTVGSALLRENDPVLVSSVDINAAPQEFTAIVSKEENQDLIPHELNIHTESFILTQGADGFLLPQKSLSGENFSFANQLLPSRNNSLSDYLLMPKPETETNSNSAVETTCVATTVNGINNLAVATVNAASTVPFAANSYNPFPHQTTTTAQLQMYQLPQYVPTCMYPYGGTTFSSAQVAGAVTSAGARGYQIANCYGSGAGGGNSTVLMSGSNQNELGRPTDSVSPQGGLAPPAISPVTPTGAINDIPSNVPYPGQCGFEIFFTKAKEVASKKTISYTYSKDCNKLYVRQSAVCPVHFKVTKKPPVPCLIRAMAIYSRPQDIGDVVKRCMNHAMDDTHIAPAHLIRTSHPHATYFEDQVTSRHSVLIPWEEPSPGSEHITGMYQFMCFSSCSGTINRRPMQIIFTLEHNGIVIGRQVVELRICACPGRDRQNDEEQQNPTKKNNKQKIEKTCTITSVEPLPKKPRPSNNDDEIYTIQVRGKELYKLLTTIANNFHLAQQYTDLVAATQSILMPRQQQSYADTITAIEEPLGKMAARKVAQDLITPETSVANWLETIEMKQYLRKFYDNSFRTMAQLENISMDTLERIGIPAEDRDRLFASLLHYKAAKCSSQMSSLATPPNCNNPSMVKISKTTFTQKYKLKKQPAAGSVELESDN